MTENPTTASATADRPVEYTTEEVLAKLEDAIAADRPRRDLRLTDSITQDIRLDSLALLEVLTRVEDEFDIELIDNPETYSARTVGDLVELVKATARAAAGGDAPTPEST
ncbi:acyl carrier protein [Streptomyces sp. TP-A0874]|uniref:acyl carrier protein n=1 Tax=Streptomyces sp. TP-A0874 TaxID=549819 RepID=UPI0008533061|nr:phosphopantetheine-binding protein [Streptomyces sp. TP-A0874]